jgi:hypothetical protein
LPVLFWLVQIRLHELGRVETRRIKYEKLDEMDRLDASGTG